MAKSSLLTVVGTGIKFLSQMTFEVRSYIKKADKVLYLLNDPILKEWIQAASKQSESLDKIYFQYRKRLMAYTAITNYILSHLKENKHICVALYGHPTVFSKPALDAARIAQESGYKTNVLPGISAEACLFADLFIDPGSVGCQSFEATDFILYQRKFDTASHLILWQPDVIGIQNHESKQVKKGLSILTEYLLDFYPSNHEIIIYEAAQYPGFKPHILKISLKELPNHLLSPICTLYIKPIRKAQYNLDFVKKLDLV